MKYTAKLLENLEHSIAAKKQFSEETDQLVIFDKAVGALVEAYKKGGRLYIAGNGGSAADAQHLAAEFVSRLARERTPLPAEALTVDTSIITAIGNDYGYDEVFSRQIIGKMRTNDVFLGITTSGNSRNIIRALEECKRLGLMSIVLTGHKGGLVRDMADYCIIASGSMTSTIQELHITIAHTLCGCVEDAMCE